MTSLTTGSTLQNGKYEIVKVLGQGGFGITYLAVHTMLDKKVAIKEFFPKDFCDRMADTNHITLGTSSSADLVSRLRVKFVKEAKNIAKLSHPNIVPIQDIFEENNTAYYLMDYIEGESLGDIIKREGAIDEDRALHYILQAAAAIGYMHSKSMNHLDIKPAHIMIRRSDNTPVLIDFGTSKQYDSEGEQTSTMAPGFTHGYAPIEQYKPGGVASFTPQTDIYALGATLYALVTGKQPPHYSEILEDGLPELPTALSQGTKEGMEHAMEIKKTRRPASIEEFVSHFHVDDSTGEPEPDIPPIPVEKDEAEEAIVERADAASTVFVQPVKDTVASQAKVSESNAADAKVAEVKDATAGADEIDGIEFVDLGLSVLWANKNIGAARPCDSGTYIDRENENQLAEVAAFGQRGAQAPTIAQFEELCNKCYWEQTEQNGFGGYRVKGRNGNSIFLPFTGDRATYFFVTFGRLYTREALAHATLHNYFYFNRSWDYQLVSYVISYPAPVRLTKPK